MGSVTHKLLLTVLLLCFQTQTLAELVHICAQGGGAEAVTEACHQPEPDAEQGDSGTPESPGSDCCGCQLGCAFGVATLPLDRSPDDLLESRPISGRVPVRHFYRFVPDPLQRPPILPRS